MGEIRQNLHCGDWEGVLPNEGRPLQAWRWHYLDRSWAIREHILVPLLGKQVGWDDLWRLQWWWVYASQWEEENGESIPQNQGAYIIIIADLRFYAWKTIEKSPQEDQSKSNQWGKGQNYCVSSVAFSVQTGTSYKIPSEKKVTQRQRESVNY